jgi:hypothetical protein
VRGDAPPLVDLMPAFGLAGESWAPWRVVAKCLDGQGDTLSRDEQALYEACTGRTRVPTDRPAEFVGIMGRRSGKSRFAGAVATRAAGLQRYPLAPGEKAVVGLAAADREQARVLLEYATAPFEAGDNGRAAGPQLADLVRRRTRWGLDLATGTSLEVRTASFGRIRGRTYAAVIADEVAFWASDDGANPATEVLTAVRPGLVTLDGPLVVITTPYGKTGPPFEAFSRYFAKDDAPVLVWRSASRVMNPTIPERVVLDALERDEASARAEWLGEFRDDLSSFIDRATIEACVVPGRRALPPRAGVLYAGFVDPAGGSGVWPTEGFRAHGVTYAAAPVPKRDAYRDTLPHLNAGNVELLDHPRLVAQFAGLERRTARSGKDSIDHPPHAHDDLANAVAGLVRHVLVEQPGVDGWAAPYVRGGYKFDLSPEERAAYAERADQRAWLARWER